MVFENAALVHTQLDDRSNKVGLGDNLGMDIGLVHLGNIVRLWHARRIVDILLLAIGQAHLILHIGYRGDNIHVEFPLQAFLHNLHVQQAQETAAEPEAQCQRALGLEGERGIVELELF